MPLSIHPVHRNDFHRIADVFWSSMSSNSFVRATWDVPKEGQTDPLDPSARRERTAARFIQSSDSPSVRFLKAVDGETGEIVAFAKWNIFLGPEGLAEWRTLTRTGEMEIPVSGNPVGFRYCWEKMYKKYKDVFGEEGREHCHLALLVTHPAHERRGAGSMLVNWGCQLADQRGVECHLEATRFGYPVYKREGFVDALGPEGSALVFDVSQFTGRGEGNGDWTDMMVMIRPPRRGESLSTTPDGTKDDPIAP